MRLTDFIAELVSIENYQKLLINKSRKYQIKNIRRANAPSSTIAHEEKEGLLKLDND